MERIRTAAQAVKRYEAQLLAGERSEDPDVVEWSEQELAQAAADGVELGRYKRIYPRKYQSKVCLDCKPQAPFEGDLSTPQGRLNAERLGVLGSNRADAREFLAKKMERDRKATKARIANSTPMARKRRLLLSALRVVVAKETRSARDKTRYAVTRNNVQIPHLLECVHAYEHLLRHIHGFLFTDMGPVPAPVWQLALRVPAKDLNPQTLLLPLLAMSIEDLSFQPVSEALAQLQVNYERYLGQNPPNAVRFPLLALVDSQAESIEGVFNRLFEHVLLDGQVRGVKGALLRGARDDVVEHGVPHLEKTLLREAERVKAMRKLIRRYRES